MAISIDIVSQLDKSSLRKTADQAQKYFLDAGEVTGRQFGKSLSEGVKAASPEFQRAFDKAADAAGKLRVEQEKLNALHAKGASDDRIVAQAERLEKARRDESRATRDAQAALSSYSSTADVALTKLSNLASGTRFGAMALDARSMVSSIDGISVAAAAAGLGIAGIAVGVGVAGKALYDLGAQWDDIGDAITGRTGKIGDDLSAITDSVRNVAGDLSVPLAQIGDIAGRVSQSLQLTGKPLEEMTSSIADLQELAGESIDVRGLSKTFRLFDVTDVQTQIKALDDLNNVREHTGAGMNELISALGSAGKAGKEFGLGIGETAGLLSTLEQAGVGFEKTGPALSFALKTFSASGRDAAEGLKDAVAEIQRLTEAGKDAQAADLAAKTFGKGYIDFLSAIKDGHLTVESLTAAPDKTGASIRAQKEATDDWKESWAKLTNTLESDFGPTASKVFSGLSGYLTSGIELGHRMSGVFKDLTTDVENTAVSTDRASASVKQLQDLLLGQPQGGPTVNQPFGILGGATLPPPGPPPPVDYKALYPRTVGGAPIFGPPSPGGFPAGGYLPDGSTKSKSEGLPTAPVLPLQYSQLAPGADQGVVSAQTRLDEAAHTLAEKQARLTQLEQTNVATAEDVQTARNAVTEAERNQLQAQGALSEAQQRLSERSNKQLATQSKQLGEIGASIDQDFGISKGLSGIAENITKFIANIAAAPLLGPLSAISQSAGGPERTGSGLIGMLASSGAFGARFQPQPQQPQPQQTQAMYGTSTAATGPTAPQQFGGAGPVGAPKPGESARDFAHRVMMPFWQGQGFTVGDHAADKYGEHQQGALDIMVKDLADGNRVLQEVLADPNAYGAIFNNQTYGYGLGPTPRDYSSGHTGDPSQDHLNHVHAWYRPGQSSIGGRSGASQSNMPNAAGANWNAMAQAESSGNWQANTGNGYFGGLQFLPSSWQAAGGTQYAPRADLATQGQQTATAEQLLSMQGPGAWPNTFVPASSGGMGTGAGFPGLAPAPQAPMTLGTGAAPMTTGAQMSSVPGGGFSGMGPAVMGAIQSGIAAGALGIDSQAPGAGEAAAVGAQIAMQEINRLIAYGGQAVGIGASGLLETFGMSDSALANPGNSWLGRIAGGFGGGRAALPNAAGDPKTAGEAKTAGEPQPAQPQTDQQGNQQGGPTGPAVQIDNYNNYGTEDRAGADLARHQMAANAGPGR